MEFKHRLQNAILQNHKNINQFAESYKLSDSMIRKYVKGDVNPTIEKVNELARHLNVSPAWLAYGIDDISEEKLDEVVELINLIHERIDDWLDKNNKELPSNKKSILVKIISKQLQEQNSFSIEAVNKQINSAMDILDVA